jgi:hypothetical protein
MAVVEMEITEPAHDNGFTGTGDVTFRGALTAMPAELKGVPLYYRWYSSLFPAEKGRYSMNPAPLAHPGDGWTADLDALGLGTHVISLAALDQPGETDADLEAVNHGGMTGGSDGDGACVIHVFVAVMIAPGDGDAVSRRRAVLEARAPALWGKRSDDTGHFEPNDDYHALNRLRYRWEFRPIGPPPGRRVVDVVPDVGELTFIPEKDPLLTRVQYTGRLPSRIDGRYWLILHVEDVDEALGEDTAAIEVTVAA